MPLGTLLQLRRPTWPDPEESAGKEFGEIPKTKFSYWQATGPALAAYQKLLPEILKVLAEKQGPIPNSDFVWFSLYMVGPSSTTAVPYIMFASEQRTQRRKAMNYIKNSKILQEYPGMQVGEWTEAPHIGSQQQKGSSGERADGKLEIPHGITADSFFSVEAQVSAVLSFHYPDRTVKATASVEVEIDGIRHYLVPSHVLIPPRPSLATETEVPENSDDEGFDFGDLVEDEDRSDDDPLVTSLGSISSSGSDSWHSEKKSLDDGSAESAVNSDPVSSTIIAQPALKPHPSSLAENDAHGDEGGTNCPVVSIDLDYALCRVTDSDTKVPSMRLPELLSISDSLVETDETGTQVQVLTVHGLLNGLLSRTRTHVLLPNSSSYQEVYVAHFDSPVLAGDCGAMVYDAPGRRAFGHIITGSASSTKQSAFVVPAKHVHEDIVRRLDMLYRNGTRQMADTSHILRPCRTDVPSDSLKSFDSNSGVVEQAMVHAKELEHQPAQKLPLSSVDEGLRQGKSNNETMDHPTSKFLSRFKKFRSRSSHRSTSSLAPSKVSSFASSAPIPPPAIGTAMSTADLSVHKINVTESEPLGLSVVYAPEHSRTVDIVFVHGLGGTSRGTWSKNRSPELFWPSKFLPLEPEMGQARILTFAYNAGFHELSHGTMSILDFAKALLFDLKYAKDEHVEDMDIGEVPLIFVAHSLGGLVVKKAYMQGQNDPEYAGIVKAVSAITFLATPHRGTNLAQALNRILTLSMPSPNKYIAELAKDSLFLQKLNEQFRHIAPKLNIISFYETRPSSVGPTQVMVAEKDSSILGYPGEIYKALDADHFSICKYASPTDPNYIKVKNVLESFMSNIAKKNDAAKRLYSPDRKALCDLGSLLAVSELLDLDYENYNFFRDQWTEGTNDWILRVEDFIKWRDTQDSNHRMLWLSGGPATGKSVMSSFIVNSLVEEGASCQYFFITFGNRGKRGLSLLLRSLAYQVAQSMPGILQKVTELRDEAIDFGTADPKIIWDRIFKSILFKLGEQHPLYWVIDGLDEAEDPSAVIKVLSDISSSSVPIRILFAGRRTSKIRAAFQKVPGTLGFKTINIEGHLDDLRQHIHQELVLPGSVEFIEDIERRIVEQSQGNFLWAHLVVQNINVCHTATDVKQALEELPMGMEALYGQMALSVARNSAPGDRSLAVKILQCVTCSLRVLKVSELAQAVGDAASGILDFQSFILDICSGFVILDDDGNAAIVHQTARNYLLQPDDLSFRIDRRTANKEMFLSCMRCLMLPGLTAMLNRNKPPEFLDYASQFWSSHLISSSTHDPKIIEILKKFLTENWVLVWIHALAVDSQLRILIRASKDLSRFASKRRDEDPLGQEFFASWATDLPRIVGKFSNLLRRKPDSIYKSIPPFCPKGSLIYQLFGKREARDLMVIGPSTETWDDSLARISLGYRPSNTVASSIVTAGSQVAILASAGSIFLYDSSDFREAIISPITPNECIYVIELNSTATLLAMYGYRTTKVWEVYTGKCITTIDNVEPRAKPLTMLFANDDSTLLVGTDDRRIRSLELVDTQPAWKVVAGLEDEDFENPVRSTATRMALSQDGSMVAVAHLGHPLSAWETDGPMHIGLCCRKDETPTINGVRKLVWRPHTPEILGLSDDGLVFKWAPYDEEMDGMPTGATTLSMSLDGVLFATGDAHGRVQLYETATFSLLYQLDTQDTVLDLAFSPDSRRFYDIRGSYANVWEPNVLIEFAEQSSQNMDSVSIAGTLWSSSSEATVVSSGQVDSITALAGSPNGRLYCCATGDGVVSLHDMEDGKLMDIYSSSAYMAIEHLCWSCDGRYVCFTDVSNQVIVMSITQWIGERKPVAEQTATVPLRKVGKISRLLFHPELGSFLICTSSQIFAISVSSSVKQSRKFEDKQIRWIVHPEDPTFLLGFGISTIYLLDWKLTEIQRYSISWPLDEATDSKTDRATKSSTEGHLLNRILVTHDKKHVVLQMGSPKDHMGAQELYFVATSALLTPAKLASAATPQEHQTSGPRSICPSALSVDLTSIIELPLAFLPGDRLVFLSKSFAICSVELRWGTSSPSPSHNAGPSSETAVTAQNVGPHFENSTRELFALPGDWISRDCLAVCSVWAAEKSLLCPRNGEVAVVKSAALI